MLVTAICMEEHSLFSVFCRNFQMLHLQDYWEPYLLLVVSAITMATEVREWKISSMCQVLTRKIKCCYNMFVRVRNFSDTWKQMHVCQMMIQQACNLLCWWSEQWTHLQNCDKRLLASSCLSVRPSICMEQLGSHWMDSCQIWYLSIFKKSLKKIQVSLKSNKNNGYFTWRPMYVYNNILLNSS
jgi:hypothetical protein